MYQQKSAVPAATGHDAYQEPTSMNSNPNLATPHAKIKLTVAERMKAHREYYEGLDEILAIFAKQHNTADRTNGPGRPPKNNDGSRTYLMYEPIKRARISPEDPIDMLRLLVWHLVQCVSAERPSGFYVFEGCGPDAAIVRWVEGFCEEVVCQVRFSERRALFLSSVADAHPLLQRAFELADFAVFIVEGFIHATCPDCQGGGSVFAEAAFNSAHYVGVIPCETCGGKGVLK